MLRHLLAAAAVGCAALTFSAAGTPSHALSLPQLTKAESDVTLVHRGHGLRFGHHHGFRHRHRFHGGIFLGAPLYGGYYYGSCRWLRHRALVTGSPYWWRRYYACRGW